MKPTENKPKAPPFLSPWDSNLRKRTNCSYCLWWCCFLVFSFLSFSICCPFCLDCVRFERLYSLFAQWLAWCDHSSGSWESVVTVEICGCGIGVFISFVCVWKGEEDLVFCYTWHNVIILFEQQLIVNIPIYKCLIILIKLAEFIRHLLNL